MTNSYHSSSSAHSSVCPRPRPIPSHPIDINIVIPFPIPFPSNDRSLFVFCSSPQTAADLRLTRPARVRLHVVFLPRSTNADPLPRKYDDTRFAILHFPYVYPSPHDISSLILSASLRRCCLIIHRHIRRHDRVRREHRSHSFHLSCL